MDSILNSLNDIVNILEKLTKHDSFDYWAFIIIPVIAAIVAALFNVIFVNLNTNKQIANQNKETYKPRLKFVDLYNAKADHTVYKFMCYSRLTDGDNSCLYDIDIVLKNIGNGIAHDITFYSLYDGESITKSQFILMNKSQKNSSTEEIEKGGFETFHFVVNFNNKTFIYPDECDSCLILCNYKDLNGNNYKLLINIVLKEILFNHIDSEDYFFNHFGTFDKSYYQEGTKEFKDRIECYKIQYIKILKEIEDRK